MMNRGLSCDPIDNVTICITEISRLLNHISILSKYPFYVNPEAYLLKLSGYKSNTHHLPQECPFTNGWA